MRRNHEILICILFLLTLPSCAKRYTVGDQEYPSLKRKDTVSFHDSLDREGLREACTRQLETLERVLAVATIPRERRNHLNEMKEVTTTLLAGLDAPDFKSFITENFEFYRAGDKESVLFTGYYTPLLSGSRIRNEVYKYPVYGPPQDLVFVNLEKFGMNGKIKGAVKGKELVPYYNRREIEERDGFDQEPFLYVDDKISLFFLHIQGSGIVHLDDGTVIRLNYAESNGLSYKGIGKQLINDGVIPQERMSMQAIRQYLTDNPDRIDHYLNQNPSYVFFKEDTGGPFGSTGTVVTSFRSIAADAKVFPKHGLAFIVTEIPEWEGEDGKIMTRPFSALVFDHDSGGAIKGPGRIDIYFGEGNEASFLAGFMKYKGDIYYLKKKGR